MHPDELFNEIRTALPYANLDRGVFDRLFQFAIDGGYVLRAYDRYKRLAPMPDGRYRIANGAVARRHRQNIGVIVEAARLKVKRLGGAGRGGRIARRGRGIFRARADAGRYVLLRGRGPGVRRHPRHDA